MSVIVSVGGPVAAQQDDPFAVGNETAESPFDSSAGTAQPSNPFAVTDGTAAPPEEDSPFDVPAAPPQVDDPFAIPSEPGVEVDPFAQPVPPGQENPFDIPGPDSQADPFVGTSAPPVAGPAISAADLAGPMGRPELRFDDPTLRRLAEIRGLYVRAATPGFQNRSELNQLVQDFKSADFNRLYAEVRTPAAVTYISELEPMFPYVLPTFPNPVKELGEQIGDSGSVIAVVDTLKAHNAGLGSRPAPNSTIGHFPEFVNRTVEGEQVADDNYFYMDPGNPLVRQYLAALLFEVQSQVAPQGVLLSSLRYPGREWGYSEEAVTAFRREVGGEGPPPPDDPVWSAWRRQQLTESIREVRNTLNLIRPGMPIAVEIIITEPPPKTWEEYIASDTYSEYMQDWIGWCRDGVINEIVFVIHERVKPQDNLLNAWIPFINSNVGEVRPVVSLSGIENFRSALSSQFRLSRERAVGTMLYHYSDPARDVSRGFFPGLRETLFRGVPGRPIGGREVSGTREQRQFSFMSNPPPSVLITSATPVADKNPLSGRDLVFATPTPIPTRSPVPTMIPSSVERVITLRNGKTFKAVVLEVTPGSLTFKSTDSANAPEVVLSRSVVQSIEPPL